VVESAWPSGDVVVSRAPTAVLAVTAAATDDELGLLLEADVALCGTHCSECGVWLIERKMVNENFSLNNEKAVSVGRSYSI
jgi:hypothetical protein